MVRLQQNIIRFYLNLERVCLEARGKGLVVDGGGTVEGSSNASSVRLCVGVWVWVCYKLK